MLLELVETNQTGKFQDLTIFTIRDEMAYRVNFQAAEDEYFAYLPIVEKMIESIKFHEASNDTNTNSD